MIPRANIISASAVFPSNPRSSGAASRWGDFGRLPAAARGSAFRPHAPRLTAPDYREVLEIEGFRIEIAETKGFRRDQEDAFFVGRFAPAAPLGRRAALTEAFRSTERITRGNYCGSTCTVAVVGCDRLLTLAHLGDSPALLFVLDGVTGDVYFKSLLTPHNTLEPAEKQRVETCHEVHCLSLESSPVSDPDTAREWRELADVTRLGRISIPNGGSLAVSRAFGDRDYDWALARRPDITEIDLAGLLPGLHVNDRVFLCVACDGLTELPSRNLDNAHLWLADSLRRTLQNQDAEHLAEHLIAHAYQHSTDNITAMLTEIPNAPLPGGGAVVMGVADGHGGAKTAWQVAENMRRVLLGDVG